MAQRDRGLVVDGVEKRGTKDLDATAKGFALTHENVAHAFRDYVGEIAFVDACACVVTIMRAMGW